MRNVIGKQFLMVAICTSMVSSMVPTKVVSQIAKRIHKDTVHTAVREEKGRILYEQNFDTPDITNWKRPKGAGTYVVENQALDVKTDGWVAGSIDYQLLYDHSSPVLQDGELIATIANKTAFGRFGMVFHYVDSANYNYVGYDVNGAWQLVQRKKGKETSKKIFHLNVDNKTFHINIQFQKHGIEVFIDGESKYKGDDLDANSRGKMGIKTWGYTDNYAHIVVDAMNYNETIAPETDDDGNYMVSFTDQKKRGGWEKTAGKGTLSFVDGKEENGYMRAIANGDTYYADRKAPNLENGFVEADVTNYASSRFALLVRYRSPSDFVGFGYDEGGWRWFQGANYAPELCSTKRMEKGVKHKVRIDYMATTIQLSIDGVRVASIQQDSFAPKEGTIGLRTWGYGTHDTQGNVKLDNVVNGASKIVMLTPQQVSIPYAQAGSYDVHTTFSQNEHAVQAITVDGEALVEDRDYALHTEKNTLTIKKEYLHKRKETPLTKVAITFANGFETNFPIHIAKPEEQVSYTRDFARDTIAGFTKVEGKGNGELLYDTSKQTGNFKGKSLYIDERSKDIKNGEVTYTFQQVNDRAPYGIVLRYTSPEDYTMIGLHSQYSQHHSVWRIANAKGTIKTFHDGVFLLSNRTKPYTIKVRMIEDVVSVYLDNEEIFSEEVKGISKQKGKVGILTEEHAQINVSTIHQQTQNVYTPQTQSVTSATIQNEALRVRMDEAFPRVLEYIHATGASTLGQELPIYKVELNNTVYTPEITSSFQVDRATYQMYIRELDIRFDVVYTLRGNALKMEITNIKDENHPISTFHFPNQALVSMKHNMPNAELRVNNYKRETVEKLKDKASNPTYNTTSIAILSNGQLAATINNGSNKNNREIAYQSVQGLDGMTTGLWSNEYSYRGLDGKVIEEPWSVVAISGDRNNDGVVDFQDGAIARRDDCYKDEEHKTRVGADMVGNAMQMIAMNVGSEAQYPFLRILDNIKKFHLGSDGFQQNIVIKGYQGEGHDSMHPSYANYNARAGGLTDLNTLLAHAKTYNASIGLHINDTDIYPEAPNYKALSSTLGAWSWYDDARMIKRENDALDTSKDGLDARLQQLITDTNNQLRMLYVDVFFGTRWPMYKLTSNINGKNIAISTEYVDEMQKDSVFAHHIDQRFNQGGNLVRFINHTQQDIFGSSPLFRGANDRNYASSGAGFFGWQNAVDYNQTLQAFYTKILPNKYLANFPINRYKDDTEAILGDDLQVVTKIVNGKNVITKDGKVIAEGNNIFLPWDPKREDKIYHYNEKGGSSTWDMPSSWHGVPSVDVYPLSDKGKGTPLHIPVVNGKVSIPANAKQGYVLYKSTMKHVQKTAMDMDWSTGSPVKDMGFDSHSFRYWKPSSLETIEIKNNAIGNTHLYIKGRQAGHVTQSMTGLTPGKTYSASVWAQVDGKTATLRVQNGTQILHNEMDRSNVVYGIHHSDKYKTYAQRMRVVFRAQETTATLTLEGGIGKHEHAFVDYDDVRVMEIKKHDTKGNTYYEDFEDMDQGYGIFVSTEADNTHLSQRNGSITKDVIEGTYSLKVRAGNYLRTLPSTLRLKPNTTYSLSMDYMDLKRRHGTTFMLGVKSDKANEANDIKHAVILEKGVTSNAVETTPNEVSLVFTTGPYEDYYIDITKKDSDSYAIDTIRINEQQDVDQQALQNLYDKSLDLKDELFTPESYQTLITMREAAKAVLDMAKPTEAAIKHAYTNLDRAMKALVAYATQVDKDVLNKSIQEMEAVLASDYQPDAHWQQFQAVIMSAKALIKEEKVTRTALQEMAQALVDAKHQLVRNIDVGVLQRSIEEASQLVLQDFQDDKARQTFITTLSAANDLLAKAHLTQNEVDAMVQKVAMDRGMLVPLQTWKEAYLKTTLADATAAEEAQYNPAVFATIQARLKHLHTLVAQANTTMRQVETSKAEVEKLLTQKLTYQVHLESTIEGAGTLRGAGTYTIGTATTLIAKANDGYLFKGWYINDKKVSQELMYTHIVSANVVLVAHFERQTGTPETTYKVDVIATVGGTISGGGSFHANDLVTIHAQADTGYIWKGFEVDGVLVSTSTTYQFRVTKHVTIRALFEALGGQPMIDTIAPSMPKDIQIVKKDATSIRLSWHASKDNVGVVGYKIFANGKFIGISTTTTMDILHLLPNTLYHIEIRAFDAANNDSLAAVCTHKTDSGATNTSTQMIVRPIDTFDTTTRTPYVLAIGIAITVLLNVQKRKRNAIT